MTQSQNDPEKRDPYGKLFSVLTDAFRRASEGKGRARHGSEKPFEEQVGCTGCRLFGRELAGPALFQIWKKVQEVPRLSEPQMKVNELYDVINYAAMAVIEYERCMSQFEGSDRPEEEWVWDVE